MSVRRQSIPQQKDQQRRRIWPLVVLLIFTGAAAIGLAVALGLVSSDSQNTASRLAAISGQFATCEDALANCTDNCTIATAPPSASAFSIVCTDFTMPIGYYPSLDAVPWAQSNGTTCHPITITRTLSGNELFKRRSDMDMLTWQQQQHSQQARQFEEDMDPDNNVTMPIPTITIAEPTYSVVTNATMISSSSKRFVTLNSTLFTNAGTNPAGLGNSQSYASIDGGSLRMMHVQSNDMNVHLYDTPSQALLSTFNLSSIFPAQCLNLTTMANNPVIVRFDHFYKQFVIANVFNYGSLTGICLAISTNETSMVFNAHVYLNVTATSGTPFTPRYIRRFDLAIFADFYTITYFFTAPAVNFNTFNWPQLFAGFNRTQGAAGTQPIARYTFNSVQLGGSYTLTHYSSAGPALAPPLGNRIYIGWSRYSNNALTQIFASYINMTTGQIAGLVSYSLGQIVCCPPNPSCDEPFAGPGCIVTNGATIYAHRFDHGIAVLSKNPYIMTSIIRMADVNLFYTDFTILSDGGFRPYGGQGRLIFPPTGYTLIEPNIAYDCYGTLFITALAVSSTDIYTVFTYKLIGEDDVRNLTALTSPILLTSPGIGFPRVTIVPGIPGALITQYFDSTSKVFKVSIQNASYTVTYAATDSCNQTATCDQTVTLASVPCTF